MMNGDDIGLVLARARLVEILAHKRHCLDTHVELGLLLESIVVLVAARIRSLRLLDEILSLSMTNTRDFLVSTVLKMVSLLQIRIERLVGSRADMILPVIRFVNLRSIFSNHKARNGLLLNLIVVGRTREAVGLNGYIGDTSSHHCHGLLLLGHGLVLEIVISRTRRENERLLLLSFDWVRSPRNAERVGSLREMHWAVMSRRWVAFGQITEAASCETESRLLGRIKPPLSILVLLRHLV